MEQEKNVSSNWLVNYLTYLSIISVGIKQKVRGIT